LELRFKQLVDFVGMTDTTTGFVDLLDESNQLKNKALA